MTVAATHASANPVAVATGTSPVMATAATKAPPTDPVISIKDPIAALSETDSAANLRRLISLQHNTENRLQLYQALANAVSYATTGKAGLVDASSMLSVLMHKPEAGETPQSIITKIAKLSKPDSLTKDEQESISGHPLFYAVKTIDAVVATVKKQGESAYSQFIPTIKGYLNGLHTIVNPGTVRAS